VPLRRRFALSCAHTCSARTVKARLAAPMTRKRDIKQFRQACKEAGLTVRERYEASQALHAEKETGGGQDDMSYGELLAWLRQWKDAWRPS